MNLDYSIKKLAEVIDAEIYNPVDLPENFKVKNVIIDTRNPAITKASLFVALMGSKEDGHRYLKDFIQAGGQLALVSKKDESLKLGQLIVSDTLSALQKLAAYHRTNFSIPIIAITGSNGKTIVKEWLYQVLKDSFSVVRSPKSYNSQLGVALSLLEITENHEVGIFEAGISMPGEMEVLEKMIKPTIGIFTGIGDAHSANFDSIEEKQKEKFKLFNSVKILFDDTSKSVFPIPFSDAASQRNASLVQQVSVYLGMSETQVRAKLATLTSVSMRLEQIEGKNNCLLLNDAYSSDLQSLEIALKQLQSITKNKKKILFLTPFEDNESKRVDGALTQLISRDHLDKLIFVGDAAYLPKLDVEIEIAESAEAYLQKNPQFENATILFKGSRKYGLEKIVQRLAAKKHVTRLVINFAAIRNNLTYFRSRLNPSTKVLVMVKAHSYGGGLTEMAHFLVDEKVDYFGVAYADEGVQLRKSGINKPILVMNPEQNAFDEIIDFGLEPGIYSQELLDSFVHHLTLRQLENYPVHIKIDTGMNRLGFVEEQIPQMLETMQAQPEVFVRAVYSHLSVADDAAENQFTSAQIRTFDILTGMIADRLPYSFERHLANSAGTANFSRAEYDMVRLGIGIFGLVDRANKSLENVLSLVTQISQIKKIHVGDSIGYGRTYIATHEHLIGIIPVGYADGLRRGLSQGNWSVLVNGKQAPVIGNICMDMCMINLEGIEAKTGDEVEVFGDHNSIFEMAMNLKTIPYEIIAGISARVHRVYIDE